ncbi:uncharacterized protein BCR38DRAFT_201795 [Pseudomassariella vexata]|uniref:Oxidoreductase acuF-like C2H2 type zinc-finger domain-containing protein n=1 Tax=Pseudomassariella vexata TaxID=1141098 RepID=A0A1Y2DXA0_9PEZI|nr:uncharacterized protein BCR38DRAFT_201795 [Pseudomassariella vexata]ORY63867.1 hypothetical protein BCR38DRAFT_201795 [Pseudomassariella vexata]
MAGIDYIARWQQAISQERGSEEPPLLAYAYKACSELYAALLAGLRDDPLIDPLVKISLERSHGYLVLWADGYGVSEGQLDSSLDRSRRARHSTIRLLVSICKTLTKCLLPNVAKEKQAQLSPKAAAVIEAADKLKYLIQQDQTNDSESDSDTSSDASSTCGVSELDDIAEDLQTDVQCLLDLGSRFVEQTVGPVPTEKAVDPADIIDWHPSKNFIDRIRWRFPRCDEDVAKRLGIANWERVLRYQDTKHRNTRPQKLTSGEPMATPVKSAASGIVASTTFHDSGLGSSIPSVPSIPAASQYAETVVSYCGGQGDAVRLPPLPQEAKRGISFPCVGCGILINVGNKSAWKKHLFQDLQPYMCLDRICIVNGAAFTTKDAWENHLVLDHRFSVNWDGIVCPVCKETIKSGKLHVTTHLARHMEEIALTVLPTNPDSEDGTDVDSGLASSEISVRDNLAGHFDGIPDTDKGADVNAQGRLYGNALQAAFKEENDKTAQVTSILNDYSASGGDCFLEKGADVNAQGGKYGNALQDASYKGHDKIVQVLVDKGVDVNAQGGLYGNALQAAFKEENDDMAQAIRDMIARSASLEEWLPTTAIERIDSYLLEPLLKDESLESFYSLISEVRERLETGMLLREVETALMVGARVSLPTNPSHNEIADMIRNELPTLENTRDFAYCCSILSNWSFQSLKSQAILDCVDNLTMMNTSMMPRNESYGQRDR